METGFKLRVIAGISDGSAMLVLEGPTRENVEIFLDTLMEAMFPPGGAGETNLVVSSDGEGYFLLETRGAGRAVKVSLMGVSSEVAVLTRSTLVGWGSVAIGFAYTGDDGFILLDPSENCIFRSAAIIDGELVYGEKPRDWSRVFAAVKENFPFVSRESQND